MGPQNKICMQKIAPLVWILLQIYCGYNSAINLRQIAFLCEDFILRTRCLEPAADPSPANVP